MPLFPLLLQAVTDTATAIAASPATQPVVAQPESLSLWQLLKEGGVLMIPLLACSILLVYVFFERFAAIRKAGRTDPYFVPRIREHLMAGNVSAARSMARTTPGPIARVIEKGLSRVHGTPDAMEKAMETAGRREVYEMEKNLGVLSTISRIAPIFGFLGTIAGMIVLFYNIQQQGFSLESIAGGIYTKMVTSAVGLIIGLLAYVAYDFLNAQINKTVNRIEIASADFLEAAAETSSAIHQTPAAA
jgi:biopolymer transport protein ExbB